MTNSSEKMKWTMLIYTSDHSNKIHEISKLVEILCDHLDSKKIAHKEYHVKNSADFYKGDGREQFHKTLTSFTPLFALVPTKKFNDLNINTNDLMGLTKVFNGLIKSTAETSFCNMLYSTKTYEERDIETLRLFIEKSTLDTKKEDQETYRKNIADAYDRINELENSGFQNNLLSNDHILYETQVKRFIPEYNRDIWYKKDTPTHVYNFEAYTVDGFFCDTLIKENIEFIASVPDIIHKWPLTNIQTEKELDIDIVQNTCASMMKLQFSKSDPKWRKEKYRNWVRFAPCSLADYVCSPIYNLVDAITKQAFLFAKQNGYNDRLRLETCVLEEITKDSKYNKPYQNICQCNKGSCDKRVVGFIYILTTETNVGADLCFLTDEFLSPVTKIAPQTNQLVLLNLRNNTWNSKSLYTGQKSCISLVGFLATF